MNDTYKKVDISVIYFVLILFILTFVRSAESSISPVTFHIQANRQLSIIGVVSVFSLLVLFKRVRLDMVTIGLILSAILGLVPLIYADYFDSYLGNYFHLLVAVGSYLIASQSKIDFTNAVYKSFKMFALIVSLQVIFTEIDIFGHLSMSNISNVLVKYRVVIPLGGSNLIAAYLLPIIIFLMTYNRNKSTLVISVIAFYAILLSRSKNAILLFGAILILIVVKRLYAFIFKDEKAGLSLKLSATAIASLFVISIMLVSFNIANNIITELAFAYNSPYHNGFINYLDTISSGRIYVYHEQLIQATEHLVFGGGYGYGLGDTKAHNWIIDLLVQRGLLGFTIYLLCLASVFKVGLKNYSNDKFTRASVNSLLVVFVQGLFEITIFTAGFDFMIWCIGGFIVAKAYRIKGSYESEQILSGVGMQ